MSIELNDAELDLVSGGHHGSSGGLVVVIKNIGNSNGNDNGVAVGSGNGINIFLGGSGD